MTSDFEAIFSALADANVRYLTVGGVAVLLHGISRFTADLDLVLDLDANNVEAALSALAALGYRPRAPVAMHDFSDPARRADWSASRGMVVFSLWSDQFPLTEIDLFVEPPFDFALTYARADHIELGGVSITTVSIADLVAMKERAGRPRDVEDVRALRIAMGRDGKAGQ